MTVRLLFQTTDNSFNQIFLVSLVKKLAVELFGFLRSARLSVPICYKSVISYNEVNNCNVVDTFSNFW